MIEVGVDSEEGPPVPIPNTVVKLFSAENTWRAAAREGKATPTYFLNCLNNLAVADRICHRFELARTIYTTEYASIAQLAEHAAVNRGVTGSSPV